MTFSFSEWSSFLAVVLGFLTLAYTVFADCRKEREQAAENRKRLDQFTKKHDALLALKKQQNTHHVALVQLLERLLTPREQQPAQ